MINTTSESRKSDLMKFGVLVNDFDDGNFLKSDLQRFFVNVNEKYTNRNTSEFTNECDRKLLTITSTFTYFKFIRWIYYYMSLFCLIVYGGIAPIYFKAYFTSKFYLQTLEVSHEHVIKENVNNLDQNRHVHLNLRLLTVSAVVWSTSLSIVVFLLRGRFPAQDSNIHKSLWYIHYGFLAIMLIFHGIYMASFLTLLKYSNEETRNIHGYKFKFFIFGFYIFVWFMMGLMATLGSFVYPAHLSKFWDATCFFEYTTIVTMMVWSAEIWRGFTKCDDSTFCNSVSNRYQLVLAENDLQRVQFMSVHKQSSVSKNLSKVTKAASIKLTDTVNMIQQSIRPLTTPVKMNIDKSESQHLIKTDCQDGGSDDSDSDNYKLSIF